MHQLPQTHPQVRIPLLTPHQPPLLLVREAILEPPKDLDVGELALLEPRLGDDAQPLAQHAEGLGAVCDDDDGLLDGGAGDVCGAVEELGGVELAGAGDAEEGGGGRGGCRGAEEGEVGEVFLGAGVVSFLILGEGASRRSGGWGGKKKRSKLTHARRHSAP